MWLLIRYFECLYLDGSIELNWLAVSLSVV